MLSFMNIMLRRSHQSGTAWFFRKYPYILIYKNEKGQYLLASL